MKDEFDNKTVDWCESEFKVGDKIIFQALCNSVLEYQECLKMFISQGLIRHATPEEITANKRLEAV